MVRGKRVCAGGAVKKSCDCGAVDSVFVSASFTLHLKSGEISLWRLSCRIKHESIINRSSRNTRLTID